MAKYQVAVERVTTYIIEADSPDGAIDAALGAVDVGGPDDPVIEDQWDETTGHTVEERS